MNAPRTTVGRVCAFNAVGVAGFALQLLVLWTLVRALRVPVLAATVVAVESAVVHNFLFHIAWTWRDRVTNRRQLLGCFLRFNATNGAVSIAVNLGLMACLQGLLGLHYLLANVTGVACASAANFLLGDRVVFPGDTFRWSPANSTTKRGPRFNG
jgi:putative flippase GtrA